MALIKCSECGKEISDKAKSCVHCGCPCERKAPASEGGELRKKASSLAKKAGIALLAIVLIVVLLCVFLKPKHISKIAGTWEFGSVQGDIPFPVEGSIKIAKNGTFVVIENDDEVISGKLKFQEIRNDVRVRDDNGDLTVKPDVYIFSIVNCTAELCDEGETIEIRYYSHVLEGREIENIDVLYKQIEDGMPLGWLNLELGNK